LDLKNIKPYPHKVNKNHPMEHLSGYQQRDYEVVDYQMYSLGTTGLKFRGPEIENLESNQYFVCLGAAQTLGCFCSKPFPTVLQDQLGLPALNLGYGGAGPYFYLKHPSLIDYINKSKFAIIQVMSGRSESNSLFDSGGLELLTRRSDGVKFGANTAYQTVLESNYVWQKVPIGQRYFRRIAKVFGKSKTQCLVAETRSNWIENYRSLLNQITVPKIIFWYSKRVPEYQEKYDNIANLFNEFPQLVNSSMIEEIKPYSDEYVECVSSNGSPQPLISRFTGKPTAVDPSRDRPDLGGKLWTHNVYYPSPEMHQDAAQALMPICQKYLHSTNLMTHSK
jgi:hypothetical protein